MRLAANTESQLLFKNSSNASSNCLAPLPEDEFYLRVNRDHPASLKVMQKNGGRIVKEDADHYYVRIKK